jgi:hypothetical protein
MRTRTIIRLIYHAPITTLAVLLGCHDKPKTTSKDFSMLIMAIAVIAAWGLILSYILNPTL